MYTEHEVVQERVSPAAAPGATVPVAPVGEPAVATPVAEVRQAEVYHVDAHQVERSSLQRYAIAGSPTGATGTVAPVAAGDTVSWTTSCSVYMAYLLKEGKSGMEMIGQIMW